jgi:hypothetical protein
MPQSYVDRWCRCRPPAVIARSASGRPRCGHCGLLVRPGELARALRLTPAGQPADGTPTPSPGASRPAGDPCPTDHYLIQRTEAGVQAWAVCPNGARTPIPHLVHHSPTGMEFGYAGSGPADLARSIVGFELQTTNPDPAVYQDFKRAFIEAPQGEEFQIQRADVVLWYLGFGKRVG